jgi:surface protein
MNVVRRQQYPVVAAEAYTVNSTRTAASASTSSFSTGTAGQKKSGNKNAQSTAPILAMPRAINGLTAVTFVPRSTASQSMVSQSTVSQIPSTSVNVIVNAPTGQTTSIEPPKVVSVVQRRRRPAHATDIGKVANPPSRVSMHVWSEEINGATTDDRVLSGFEQLKKDGEDTLCTEKVAFVSTASEHAGGKGGDGRRKGRGEPSALLAEINVPTSIVGQEQNDLFAAAPPKYLHAPTPTAARALNELKKASACTALESTASRSTTLCGGRRVVKKKKTKGFRLGRFFWGLACWAWVVLLMLGVAGLEGVEGEPIPDYTYPKLSLTCDYYCATVRTSGIRQAVDAYITCTDNSGANCGGSYGPIEDWDTSLVTDMSELFRDKGTLNADISAWNVGAVTNMQSSTYTFFFPSLQDWDFVWMY